jgi:hypothetical protein
MSFHDDGTTTSTNEAINLLVHGSSLVNFLCNMCILTNHVIEQNKMHLNKLKISITGAMLERERETTRSYNAAR